MNIEKRGTILYLDNKETSLLKKVIETFLIDNLLSKTLNRDEEEQISWLKRNL